jgi:hypothetical protein
LSASHALSWHLRQPEFSPLFKRDYSELLVTRSCIDCLAASPLHLHVARFKGCHSFPSKMMMTLISNCESAIPMISIAQSGFNDDLSCTYLYPTRLVSSPSFRHCCCCSSQCPCSLAGGALVQVRPDLLQQRDDNIQWQMSHLHDKLSCPLIPIIGRNGRKERRDYGLACWH